MTKTHILTHEYFLTFIFMTSFQKILLVGSIVLFLTVVILYQRGIEEQKNLTVIENAKRDVEMCPLNYEPVCGVDSNTYANSCSAQTKNHVEIAYQGECTSQKNATVGNKNTSNISINSLSLIHI